MAAVALLFLALVALPAAAGAQSELVRTEDGARTLVNKDVNGERWAITYDRDRRAVTGNVLLPGGATFIDCAIVGLTAVGTLTLRCRNASAGEWADVGVVSLPASFLGISTGCPEARGSFKLTYSDSCGVRGTAAVDFLNMPPCALSEITYDATDVAIEGVRVSAEVDASGGVAFRLDYHGACQGSATGAGRVVQASTAGNGFLEGSAQGSTSCCDTLTASFGMRE